MAVEIYKIVSVKQDAASYVAKKIFQKKCMSKCKMESKKNCSLVKSRL